MARRKVSTGGATTWSQIILKFENEKDADMAENKWLRGEPLLGKIPIVRTGNTIILKTNSFQALSVADNVAQHFRKNRSVVKLTYK